MAAGIWCTNGAVPLVVDRMGGELNHAAPSVAAGLDTLISPTEFGIVDLILAMVAAPCRVPPDTPVARYPRMDIDAGSMSPTVTELMNTPAIRMVFPLPEGFVRATKLFAAKTPGTSSWLKTYPPVYMGLTEGYVPRSPLTAVV